jgi:hypothetical protein
MIDHDPTSHHFGPHDRARRNAPEVATLLFGKITGVEAMATHFAVVRPMTVRARIKSILPSVPTVRSRA